MKNGLSIIHITQIKLWLAIISLSTYLDLHFTTYEKVLILGDFNVGTEEQHTRAFCGNYNLASLTKQPTFYKNPNNPTCTELILSNTPRSLLSTWVIETGLADFHVMTLSLKRGLENSNPDWSIIGSAKTQIKQLGSAY